MAACFLTLQFVSEAMPMKTLNTLGSCFRISSPFASMTAQYRAKPIFRQGYYCLIEGNSLIRFRTLLRICSIGRYVTSWEKTLTH